MENFLIAFKISYFIFAANAITGALVVILAINPVHSVLGLIFVFFNSACLLILLNCEFLSLLFIVVYVGAIAVLFLFVIMMLNLKIKDELGSAGLKPLTLVKLILALLFIYMIGSIWFAYFDITPFDEYAEAHKYYMEEAKTKRLQGKWNLHDWVRTLNPEEHPEFLIPSLSIGSVLYTDFLPYFIMSAIVLLIAMVGSIVITTKFNQNVHRQSSGEQISRNSKDSTSIH